MRCLLRLLAWRLVASAVCLLEWSSQGRSVYRATIEIQGERRRRRQSSQAKEDTLWTKTSLRSLV